MNAVAKNLKRLRTRLELTQEALAERLHVTRQTVSSWETGKTRPDIEILAALAEALGTDVNELIYGPAAGGYRRFQRRYVAAAAACVLVLAVCAVLDVTLRPYLRQQTQVYLDMWPFWLYILVVPAAQYLAAGLLGPAAVSLWGDIRVRSRRARRVCLLLAALALGAYLLWVSVWFMGGLPRFLSHWFHLLASNGYETLRYGPLFLSGLFFYLGLNRSPDA